MDCTHDRLSELEQFRQELLSTPAFSFDAQMEARVRSIAEEVTKASERAMVLYIDSVRTELSSGIEQDVAKFEKAFADKVGSEPTTAPPQPLRPPEPTTAAL